MQLMPSVFGVRATAKKNYLIALLDYLVGKTSVEIDSKTLNRLQDIQKLNEHDKATVFEMVDAFLRDRKAKKAYTS
jgi:hypothetical protein